MEAFDFARVSLSQLAEYIPELNVLQMPYLYSDSDHMWKVLDGRIGSDFLEKVSKSELIGLSWYDAGARNFIILKDRSPVLRIWQVCVSVCRNRR